MTELLIALGAFAALAGLSLVVVYVPWMWLFASAIACTLLGFLLGVPIGVYYHVVLRRELLRLHALPPRWWWRPHALHGALDETGRSRVLRWFFLGGTGFALVLLGCVLTLLAAATGP